MIAYIKGKLEVKTKDYIVVDVMGIGYKIFMSDTSINELEKGKEVKIYTYMKVSENDMSLYGFLNNEDLVTFELLITVGGIGAKSAISILSNITPSKFALAVISSDINTLKKLPGIGPKTAQRIILELKDKMKTDNAIVEEDSEVKTAIKLDNKANDAAEALCVLGYARKDVETVLEKIDTQNLTVEDIIKQGLKHLGR